MLAALAAAEACRIPEHPVTTLAAATLTAAVSFVVATLALIDLVRAAQDEHAATEGLARELAGARMAVSDLGAWRAEISHDARNTLAGIRAAMHTLDRHAGELDPTSAGRLRLATLAELTHLEHMLVRPHQDAGNFDVADVVRTLTDVRRADGLDVEVIAPSALVYGVPGDVATALQNLLVNAAEHAPGRAFLSRSSRGQGGSRSSCATTARDCRRRWRPRPSTAESAAGPVGGRALGWRSPATWFVATTASSRWAGPATAPPSSSPSPLRHRRA
jgi:signal transduction histidine kinase